MTATAPASPPGRSPPQLPAPPPLSSPRKPMSAGHRHEGRRGGHCLGGLTSCFFGGSPVADSDAGHTVDDHRGRRSSSWFTWSRNKKKKKRTVLPVDAPVGEPAPGEKAGDDDRGAEAGAGRVEKAAGKGGDVQNYEEEKEGIMKQHSRRTASPAKKPPAVMESLGQWFFEKLGKGNKDKSGPKVPFTGSHTEVSKYDQSHQRRQPPPPQWQVGLASLSPKYDARRRPAARTRPEPARNAPSRTGRAFSASAPGGTPAPSSPDAPAPQYSTTSPRHGASASRLGCLGSQKNTAPELEPPHPHPPGRNDQLLGLSVMAVVMVVMVFFGRVCAVLLTCLWLYCLPRVRATMAEPQGAGSKSAGAGIDLDSEEYKKKVVLEGLLQRDGRR